MHSLNTIVNKERDREARQIIERNQSAGVYTAQERRFQADVDAAAERAKQNQAATSA